MRNVNENLVDRTKEPRHNKKGGSSDKKSAGNNARSAGGRSGREFDRHVSGTGRGYVTFVLVIVVGCLPFSFTSFSSSSLHVSFPLSPSLSCSSMGGRLRGEVTWKGALGNVNEGVVYPSLHS